MSTYMRIDQIEIANFKGFQHLLLDLNSHFTLLIGDNGTGKTSALDALAVALGFWQHKAAPGSGWRNILTEEIRLEATAAGDRSLFNPILPTRITAKGSIGSVKNLTWTRIIREGKTRTSNAGSKPAEQAIGELLKAAEAQTALLPVLAYYGAGRAWLPTNKRPVHPPSTHKPQRFDAYYNCLDTRIRDHDLNNWFLFEAAAANGQAAGRPGFQAVRRAVLNCIPGADGLRFDGDRRELVLSMGGHEQPFYNLSAGQRMMLALVADIAIKAVTLNSYLLGPGQAAADDPIVILQRSPGIVLIDELDVHLHPKWQHRVAGDLKRTFQAMQFVCTSHSPQVIGELKPGEIRRIEAGAVYPPPRSYGIDSNRILQEVMDATPRNADVEGLLKGVAEAIDQGKLDHARTLLDDLVQTLGSDDPEVTRLQTLLNFLEPER